jgi:hypothetical protein
VAKFLSNLLWWLGSEETVLGINTRLQKTRARHKTSGYHGGINITVFWHQTLCSWGQHSQGTYCLLSLSSEYWQTEKLTRTFLPLFTMNASQGDKIVGAPFCQCFWPLLLSKCSSLLNCAETNGMTVGCEVLTAVMIMCMVSTLQCCVAGRHFRGTYRCHLQGWRESQARNQQKSLES